MLCHKVAKIPNQSRPLQTPAELPWLFLNLELHRKPHKHARCCWKARFCALLACCNRANLPKKHKGDTLRLVLPVWVYLHADATQPATGHLALPVLSFPFPLISVSSRDLNFASCACLPCMSGSFLAFPFTSFRFISVSAPFILERPFIRIPFPQFLLVLVTSTSLPISRQFPAHPFISLQFLFVSFNFQQFLFVPVLRFPSHSALAFWFFASALFTLGQFLSLPFRSLPVSPSLHFPFVVCNFQRQHA